MRVGSCGGAGGAGAAATRRGGVAGAGVSSAVGGGGGGFLCSNLWRRRSTFCLRDAPIVLTDGPIVVPIVATCFLTRSHPEVAVTNSAHINSVLRRIASL